MDGLGFRKKFLSFVIPNANISVIPTVHTRCNTDGCSSYPRKI